MVKSYTGKVSNCPLIILGKDNLCRFKKTATYGHPLCISRIPQICDSRHMQDLIEMCYFYDGFCQFFQTPLN